MKEQLVKFITPDWAGWRLENSTEPSASNVTHKIVVDENLINDTMEYGGIVAKVKEPLMESIMNIFVRIISGVVPNSDLKCAYVLDFGNSGKVNLFMAGDVWSSHALVSTRDSDKLDLLIEASKEYIRYRCFVDSIQPSE